MPQTTTPRGKSEPVTNLTPAEAAMLRGTLAALNYLADREKCQASKDAAINLTAVLAKWEKKPKPKTPAA